ncbi:hypothetical protein PTKIN_Ptkin03bG0136500 [Pterospermum kingtungense]
MAGLLSFQSKHRKVDLKERVGRLLLLKNKARSLCLVLGFKSLKTFGQTGKPCWSLFAAMASTKVQRIMTQPINLIFRFLQSKARIQIWLFEQRDLRIEGRIIGFDEYMNLVLDDAEEVNIKKKSRKSLGRILLKGDNITLMMNSGK